MRRTLPFSKVLLLGYDTLSGLGLIKEKNYVVFPPSVDSLFIRQSPAGTSSEFAVITGAMNAQ